jgi:hypothetical protein
LVAASPLARAASTARLNISALCHCWGLSWWALLTPVKLCLFLLCRLATVGGDMAGLLGLLGVVLELLELGLVITGDEVVVELPPDDTLGLDS